VNRDFTTVQEAVLAITLKVVVVNRAGVREERTRDE
jgi:hypothetical protein